jgi:hypothetical protein
MDRGRSGFVGSYQFLPFRGPKAGGRGVVATNPKVACSLFSKEDKSRRPIRGKSILGPKTRLSTPIELGGLSGSTGESDPVFTFIFCSLSLNSAFCTSSLSSFFRCSPGSAIYAEGVVSDNWCVCAVCVPSSP